MQGDGALTKVGSGVTSVTGVLSHTGGISVSAGTLGLFGDVSSLESTVTVGSGATLGFGNTGSTQTLSAPITGAGGVSLINAGTTTLSGDLDYAGTTAVKKGTLVFNGSAPGMSGPVVISRGAIVQLGIDGAQTFAAPISGNGSLTKVSGGTTTLSGALSYAGRTNIEAGILSVSTGGSFTGDIAISSGAIFQDAISGVHTIANDISGAGSLKKSATGTGTFSGDLSYTGATNIAFGTLAMTGSDIDLTGTITAQSGATLQLGSSSAQSFSSTLQDDGALTKVGSGVTSVTGVLTHTGGTSVSAGTLGLFGDTSSFVSTVTVGSGATLGFGIKDSTQTFSAPITGAGGVSLINDGTTTLSGDLDYTGTTAVKKGTLVFNGSAPGISGPVVISSSAIVQLGTDGAQTFAAPISGNGSLTKVSGGTTTLSGALSHVGITSIEAGTLSITTGGTYSGDIDISSGAIFQDAITGVHAIANDISGEGQFVKTTSGTTTLSGDLTFSGATSLTDGGLTLTGVLSDFPSPIAISSGTTLTVGSSSGAQVLTGAITNSGSLVKALSGKTTLSGGHNFSGTTSVNAGTLILSGLLTDLPSDVTIGTGATLQLGSANSQILSGSFAGAGTLIKTLSGRTNLTGTYGHTGTTTISAGTLAITGDSTTLSGAINIADGAFFEFGTPGTTTLTNTITGAGGFIKSGSGTTTLSGGYSFTGDTDIKRGTLLFAGAVSGYKGDVQISNGAILQLGDTANQTFSGDISGSGSLVKTNTGTLTLSGDLTYEGPTSFQAGGLILDGGITDLIGSVSIADGLTLQLGSSSTQTISGSVSGQGGVTKTSAGLTNLSGDVIYIGDTIVSAGSLRFSGNFERFRGDITVASGGDFQLGGNSTQTFFGDILGAGTFTKTGIGTVTLSASQAFTGNTAINEGALVVNTSLSSPTVNIAKGASLQGTGIVNTVVSSGTVSPGNSIGTLTVAGNYTQNSGSILVNEFDDTSSDLLRVAGSVTLNSGSQLLLSPGTDRVYSDETTYTFVTAENTVNGKFSSINFTKNSALDIHQVEIEYLSNRIDLIINPFAHVDQMTRLQSQMALKVSDAQLSNFKAVNDRNLYSYDWCSSDCKSTQEDEKEKNGCEEFSCKNKGWDIYALTNYTQFDLKTTSKGRGGHIKASATTLGAEYVFDDYGSIGAGLGYTYGQVAHPAGFNTKTRSDTATFGVNAIYAPIKYLAFDFVGDIEKSWYSIKRQTSPHFSHTEATAYPNGYNANASLRMTGRYCLFTVLFQPFFSSQYSWRNIKAYTEQGNEMTTYKSGKINLSYFSGDGGVMISRTVNVKSYCLIPHVNVSYVFKYNSPTATVSETNRADSSVSREFKVEKLNTNYLKVGGGLDVLNKETFRAYVEANGYYDDELSSSFDARLGFNFYF